MRKLRYVGLGILVLAAAGIGLYYFVVYDPNAPRSDWPILQAAASATDTARLVVGQNVNVSADLAEFKYWECVIAADPEDAGRLFIEPVVGASGEYLAQAHASAPDADSVFRRL